MPFSNIGGSGSGASDAGDLTYTPTTDADWDGDADPGNADDAFDQLAERVDDNEIAIADGILMSQIFS